MMGIRAVSTLMLWHVAMCQIICKDGTPDDYNCGVSLKCAKGQCIGITKNLCTDAAVDYVCTIAQTCGRGICVDIMDTLCGTSGTTTCAFEQTCCGVTAATKNSDMVCNTMMDPCPEDQKSDIYDHPVWYSYSADGGSSGSSSAAASLGSGALGADAPTSLFALLGAIGAFLFWHFGRHLLLHGFCSVCSLLCSTGDSETRALNTTPSDRASTTATLTETLMELNDAASQARALEDVSPLPQVLVGTPIQEQSPT